MDTSELAAFIVDRVNVGVVAIDRDIRIRVWNRFMEVHSGRLAAEVVGCNLFECFPELPRDWLELKLRAVFVLKSFAFSSWEQRPYLFKLSHNRPVTGGVDYMQQDCTFMPVRDQSGEVQYVCMTVFDATDTSLYQTRLKEALVSLEQANRTDGLTGVYNRRHLEHCLKCEFDRVKRYGGSLSLVLLDLDHFKQINDRYGHLAGDEVLRVVAKRGNAELRVTDVLGRYGGEEFAIILPGIDCAGAYHLAKRLCRQMTQEPVVFEFLSIPITISAGITEMHAGLTRYEDMINEADMALYLSKQRGRNRISCSAQCHGEDLEA